MGSVSEVRVWPPMWRRKQSYTQKMMSSGASPRVYSRDRTTTTTTLPGRAAWRGTSWFVTYRPMVISVNTKESAKAAKMELVQLFDVAMV